MSLQSGLYQVIWAQPPTTTDPDIFVVNGRTLPDGLPVRGKLAHRISKITSKPPTPRKEIDANCWAIRFRNLALFHQETHTVINLTSQPAGDTPAPTGLTAYMITDIDDLARADEAVTQLKVFMRANGQTTTDSTLEKIHELLLTPAPVKIGTAS